MPARILNGYEIRDQIYAELMQEISALAGEGIRPGLAAVLVGENPASKLYVNSKIAACAKLGITSFLHSAASTLTTAELIAIIEELNRRDEVDGILVQMPLPLQIDRKAILAAVDPLKDVDGFHPRNVGNLVTSMPGLHACTPSGVIEILRRSGIPIEGQTAVVMGRSLIVGRPMGLMLLRAHATVTVCHKRSRVSDVKEATRRADILVVAIGRPGLVTADYIRPGGTVIDVGQTVVTDPAEAERIFAKVPDKLAAFRRKGSILSGDVHPDAYQVAGAITPVPGGVGPLTIAMLMSNTVRAARLRRAGLPAPRVSSI